MQVRGKLLILSSNTLSNCSFWATVKKFFQSPATPVQAKKTSDVDEITSEMCLKRRQCETNLCAWFPSYSGWFPLNPCSLLWGLSSCFWRWTLPQLGQWLHLSSLFPGKHKPSRLLLWGPANHKFYFYFNFCCISTIVTEALYPKICNLIIFSYHVKMFYLTWRLQTFNMFSYCTKWMSSWSRAA